MIKNLLLLLFVIIYTFFLWPRLNSNFIPLGDLAANDLQIQLVAKGEIPNGAYSRFQINHPGPFSFYLQALFENYLSNWLGVAASHTWAVYAIQISLFLLLVSYIQSSYQILGGGLLFLLCNFIGNNWIVETWTPFLLVFAPSLGFLSLRDLDRWYSPIVFLVSQSIALQANIIYVFSLVPLILFGAYNYRKSNLRINKLGILFGLILFALIWSPVVAEEFSKESGNLKKILLFAAKSGTKKKVLPVLKFLNQPLFHSYFSLLAIASIFYRDLKEDLKLYIKFLWIFSIFMIISMFRMQGPIAEHLYWSITSLLALFILYSSIPILNLTSKIWIKNTIGIALLFSFLLQDRPLASTRDIAFDQNPIENLGLPQPIRFDWKANASEFANSDKVLGILAYLARKEYRICLGEPWEFLVPDSNKCSVSGFQSQIDFYRFNKIDSDSIFWNGLNLKIRLKTN